MATCASASSFLKIAAFLVLVALGLHIAGFATASWTTLEASINISLIYVTIKYTLGLLRHCYCIDILNTCVCESISYAPAWHKATTGLCGFAVAGLVIGTIITLITVCSSTPSKSAKKASVFFIGGSGVLLLVAIILYGVESKNHMDQIVQQFETLLTLDVDSLSKPGYSFILSTISAVLCLVVSALMVYDLQQPEAATSTTAPVPTIYYGQQQGHVVNMPPGQSGYGYGMQPPGQSGYDMPPPGQSGYAMPPPDYDMPPQGYAMQPQGYGMQPSGYPVPPPPVYTTGDIHKT